MTSPQTQSTLTIPASACLWAVIPATERADGAGRSLRTADRLQAAETLGERSPLPAESLLIDSGVSSDGSLIVCGVPRALIAASVSEPVVAAHPDGLPPFLAENCVDPRTFNLLVGEFAPTSVAAEANRAWRRLSLLLAVLFICLAIGIWRRAESFRESARSADIASANLLTQVSGEHAASDQRSDISSLMTAAQAEMSSLHRQRLAPGRPTPDALAILNTGVRTASGVENVTVRSLRSTPRSIELSLAAPDRDRAVAIAGALASTLRWTTTPPTEGRSEGAGDAAMRIFTLSAQAPQSILTQTGATP